MDHTTITSFADACKALNLDPAALLVVTGLPEKHQKALIAHYQLITIAQALNDGWEPDWTNHSQWKYYPWFDVEAKEDKTGVGLSYHDYASTLSFTGIGSRLCYHSEELAAYAGTIFKDLYEVYFLYK